MKPRVLWFLLVTAGVGACDRSDSNAAAIPTRDSARTAAHVALDGEGIRMVSAPTGSARLLAFGSPSAQAIAAVSQVYGAPIDRATNRDCGAGAMEFVGFRDGMMLNVQDERLVGWTVRPGSTAGPTTMSGIGLGATRAQLESVYAATIRQSSIGTEFSAGGIAGVLASAAPDARITDIWAGLNCIAR
jgi:hypothetical protein